MSQPLIDLKNITKSFDGTVVLDDLNLAVAENTFVTLLGPSGCGKTHIWRCLQKIFPGRIVIEDVSNLTNDGWKGDKK